MGLERGQLLGSALGTLLGSVLGEWLGTGIGDGLGTTFVCWEENLGPNLELCLADGILGKALGAAL